MELIESISLVALGFAPTLVSLILVTRIYRRPALSKKEAVIRV